MAYRTGAGRDPRPTRRTESSRATSVLLSVSLPQPNGRRDGFVAVTDQVVAAILDESAGLALQVPVSWKDRPGAVRAQMAVHNVHALQLFVGMQVTKDRPWKPSVYLMYENEHLRRLI